MIVDRVRSTINKYNLLQKGDKIVLGLSGGPDSVCLLHVLKQIEEEYDISIYAAHLNHQIRGIEAQKDVMYISSLCDNLGIKFFVKSINVPEYCKKHGLSIEEGARKLRYEMFYEIKQKTKSNKIAIGHNLNDQAETILMRMMRGTGLQGLKGIEYKRDDTIIRPILDIERSSIEAYCEENNLNPRIDSTNLENIYTRNKIRLDLIPYMQENFNTNVIESICRMGNNLKLDSDYIEQEGNKKFEEVSKLNDNESVEIILDKYIDLHKAIKSRIIRNAIKYILGDTNFVDQKHIEDVLNLENIDKINKKLVLPRGLFVYRNDDSILVTTEEITYEEVNFKYKVPKDGIIKIKETGVFIETKTMSIERFKSMRADKSSKGFDLDKFKGGIIARNRESGDKIKLAGGSKKLKNLFIDLKIPREERSKIPVLVDNDEVVCVGDYKINENYKIDANTKEVLKITFKKL
ncbi:tRNA lysidine(34) synthetase TilS [Paraclostridium ghonii]|uniref:tRNA lysidine(34) synthetase TilS n=1 Tax=Paraclostridium ghonii TaxID=29358 RepID=UPI00202CB6ED|nr:tRNA lysidine(34) synthetase TilS [Paeniclostridium ghonii]MCM0167500.1 tRNA lysidine(34) synthetase TilS [Paeniclostridium ghonii]